MGSAGPQHPKKTYTIKIENSTMAKYLDQHALNYFTMCAAGQAVNILTY